MKMGTPLTLTPLKSGIYQRFAASAGAAKAPPGSEQLTVSPRQTAALLPTEMTPTSQNPASQGVDIQDVTGKKQEQSRQVEDARQLAEKANSYMRQADTQLEFKVNEQTGRVVISVVASDTKEVIRQIPPESLHRFADRITQMQGLLFDTTG